MFFRGPQTPGFTGVSGRKVSAGKVNKARYGADARSKDSKNTLR